MISKLLSLRYLMTSVIVHIRLILVHLQLQNYTQVKTVKKKKYELILELSLTPIVHVLLVVFNNNRFCTFSSIYFYHLFYFCYLSLYNFFYHKFVFFITILYFYNFFFLIYVYTLNRID